MDRTVNTPLNELERLIDEGWERRRELSPDNAGEELAGAIEHCLDGLESGVLRVAEPVPDGWRVNEWLKKAVLLSFRIRENVVMEGGFTRFFDKVPLRWAGHDAAAAAEQYASLESLRGTMQTPFSLVISGDHVLGLLSQTMGDLDRAATHFDDAMAFCRKAGYRPELAWTCCDYADTLIERDGEGDHAKTITLLDESLAISSELGMRPLMERVLAKQEILET